MTNALLSGVSGLLAHQVRMDSVGNNIANANTVGFKTSHTLFADTLYQTLRPASGPTETMGGANPSALGMGVSVASVTTDFGQGALQSTGRGTDVAIEGNGFLAVTDGRSVFLTRNGSLGIDSDGSLVHLATKMRVLATVPGAGGEITPTSTLKVPVGQAAVARATSQITLGGNLDARLAGAGQTITAQVYDSLGAAHRLSLELTQSATPGVWDVAVTSPDGTVTSTSPLQIAFDAQGNCTTPSLPLDLALTNPAGAQASQSMTLQLGGVTQLAQEGTAALAGQDGLPPGSLTSLTIRDSGEIAGIFSNGMSRSVGQLVTAVFANPNGLEHIGNGLFRSTANSGEPAYSNPGSAGHGAVRSGYLEGSNVDLAEEFTDMIVTQRGYQASSRVISTADEMLQELMQVLR